MLLYALLTNVSQKLKLFLLSSAGVFIHDNHARQTMLYNNVLLCFGVSEEQTCMALAVMEKNMAT